MNIIQQAYLHASDANVSRLLVKFEENEYEKVKRLMDVHEQLSALLKKVDDNRSKLVEMAEDIADQETLLMDMKLDRGLLTYLQCSYLLMVVRRQETVGVSNLVEPVRRRLFADKALAIE